MNVTTAPGGQAVEFRSYHDTEVGIIYGALDDGTPMTWIVFPDGKLQSVNPRAYENLDDAYAAQVAVWRIRKARAEYRAKNPEPAPIAKQVEH